MTTSQQSRLGSAPEEGMKAPVVTISSGPETLFDIGQMIAGVTIADQDRVAINAQTDSTENGIYVARGGKSWVRATDMNNPDDVQTGQLFSDENTLAVYSITVPPGGWSVGQNSVSFGLLLSPVGFFWGAITGTLSNQADLQIELDAKSDTGHAHVEADITDLQAYILDAAGSIAMDGEFYARQDAGWSVIDFSVFAPAVHTHVEADITDLQLYLIDAAGSIANDDKLYARANGQWQNFSVASGTTGEIIAWPDADVPQNFLDCDGASYNAVTFADLFAVLGYKYGGSGANFNVPDLRGQFIRGTANGSGQDPDRTFRTDRGDGATGDLVGTRQSYEIQSHRHTVPVRVDPDSDTEGGGGDPRPDFGPLSTSFTGGSETRPRNVYMNYIIRYTGGGSGITQPPTVEVQDSGVPLTTAVQLLNFEGFTLTEPVDDQITIQFGASPNSALYCPGYTFNFINTIDWSIENFDVTNLFTPGRRLMFTDGASIYYGSITTSTFSGGDTLMTMSMEDSEVLTATISEVCLVTGSAGWAPIAGDPFGGTQINDFASGFIGGTKYWVMIGQAGRVAYSTDKGVSWTVATSGTSENLNQVEYGGDSETFLIAADNETLLRSTDGETWVVDTTEIAALVTSGAGHVVGVGYDLNAADNWAVMFLVDGANFASAFSLDDGLTWAVGDPGLQSGISVYDGGFHPPRGRRTALGFDGWLYGVGEDTYILDTAIDTTGSLVYNTSGQPAFNAADSIYWTGITRDAIVKGNQLNSGTAELDDQTFGASEIVAVAWSESLERLVMVGEDSKIGTMEAQAFADATNNFIELQGNGGNPLADFTCLRWDEGDGVFIAGNNQGQVLRSTNGLTPVTPVEYTGFRLINADPFAGTRINRIMSGLIGGTTWWVAVGQAGALFTSVDAGITWVAQASGTTANIISVAYNSTDQQFCIGAANGDFAHTTDGSTWTPDTTTIAALGGAGSNAIRGLVWDFGTVQWWFEIAFNITTVGDTYTTDNTLVTFTLRDGSSAMPALADTFARKTLATTLILFPLEGGDDAYYYAGASDTTEAQYSNLVGSQITAIGVAAGTDGFSNDVLLGSLTGDIARYSDTGGGGTKRGYLENAPEILAAGRINGIAHGDLPNRWIIVCDNNEIFTMGGGEMDTAHYAFNIVNNPFTGNITDVWYDSDDDMFIAVGNNGEIGRSEDGISVPAAPGSWGALETSPFGGDPINAIETGLIGVDQWWVAVGDNGKLATSTDAGVTWTLRTSGVTENFNCIAFDAGNEVFICGADAGEYCVSDIGTAATWSAETIIGEAVMVDGSGKIYHVEHDPDGINSWWMLFQRNSTSPGTAFTGTARPAGSNWSAVDGTINSAEINGKSSYLGSFSSGRIAFCDRDDIWAYTNAIDSSPALIASRTGSPTTALKHKLGTLSAAVDIIFGTSGGDLFVWDVTERSNHTAMTGEVKGIEFSAADDRVIAVGVNGQIRAIEAANLNTDGSWYYVGSNFVGHINDIKYGDADGVFIAVSSAGEIGRSTDGIS